MATQLYILSILTLVVLTTVLVGTAAGQAPKFQKGGIVFSPSCGLKSGVGTWTALGTLKGDIADYVFHLEVYIWDFPDRKRVGSPCFLDLTVCTSNPPDSQAQDFICYCTETTGTGSSAEYSLNITATAKASQSDFEVKAELKHKNPQVLSVEEFDIGQLPVIYEEVVPTIEIDDGGKQLLTPVTNILIDTSSPTIKVEFCAKHMQPGGEISIKSGFFLEQECTADEWASNTPALHFHYRQPDFTLPCDTGKSFTIKLAGVTTQGHSAPLFTKQLEVKTASVSVGDLVSELRDLKQVVYQQRNVTYIQQQQIDTDKNIIESLQKQAESDKKMIESLQKQAESDKKMIDSLQNQVDSEKSKTQSQIQSLTQEVARVGHTESGHVDCGLSRSWTSGSYTPSWDIYTYSVSKSVRVNFNTTYSRPPHVQLSIVGIETDDKYEAYGVDVMQVDTSGFTMVCFTYDNTNYVVYDLDVTWTSIAAV